MEQPPATIDELLESTINELDWEGAILTPEGARRFAVRLHQLAVKIRRLADESDTHWTKPPAPTSYSTSQRNPNPPTSVTRRFPDE